jgi:hypothetical protein
MKAQERFPSDARGILDVLGFIKNHVLPFYALKVLLILSYLVTANIIFVEPSVARAHTN